MWFTINYHSRCVREDQSAVSVKLYYLRNGSARLGFWWEKLLTMIFNDGFFASWFKLWRDGRIKGGWGFLDSSLIKNKVLFDYNLELLIERYLRDFPGYKEGNTCFLLVLFLRFVIMAFSMCNCYFHFASTQKWNMDLVQ